jgi:hypothetical protein
MFRFIRRLADPFGLAPNGECLSARLFSSGGRGNPDWMRMQQRIGDASSFPVSRSERICPAAKTVHRIIILGF